MVTIIIAVYNMEKYLRECLDSVFGQSYTDIEVIVVDDGSSDSSLSILENYQLRYANLIVLNQENQGQAVARNNALKHAKGKYITYLDSDDYLELDAVQKMVKKCESNNADMIITGYKTIYDEEVQGANAVLNVSLDFNQVYDSVSVAQMMLREEIPGFSCTKMFKRSLLEKSDFTQEKGRYIEDLFPVFKAVMNSERIVFLEGFTYNYRQRASSSTNERSNKLIVDYIHATDQVIAYASEKIGITIHDIEVFKTIAYLSLIKFFTQANLNFGGRIYSEFKNASYYSFTPKLISTLRNNDLTLKRKISLLLWKTRLYHLVIQKSLKDKYKTSNGEK